DLGRDLRGGQHAAEARLGALAQLDLDRLDVRALHGLEGALEGEVAVWVAAAEIAGPDLPDDVAAVAVMIADATFAGVLQRAREHDAAIDRLDGRARQRAIAHRGGVDDRRGTERVLAA